MTSGMLRDGRSAVAERPRRDGDEVIRPVVCCIGFRWEIDPSAGPKAEARLRELASARAL